MANKGYEGALKTALANMQALRRDTEKSSDDPIIDGLIVVMENALAPHPDIGALSERIDTVSRLRAGDARDLGIVAERLQGAERRLDGVGMTLGWERGTGMQSADDRLRVLESDVRELCHRDQLTSGKIDGLHSKLTRTITDLRGAEGAIGELAKQYADTLAAQLGGTPENNGAVAGDDGIALHTLHIEHLHIGEHLDATGAQLGDERPDRPIGMLFADLVRHRRRERQHTGKITPAMVATASGEELDAIADRLWLARREFGGDLKHLRQLETDDELRLRCGGALFADGMTIEAAEGLAREAARAWNAKNPGTLGYLASVASPTWRPHAWVVNAIIAASGVTVSPAEESPTDLAARMRREWEAETAIGGKDRSELSRAISDANRLREIVVQTLEAMQGAGIQVLRWRDLPSAVVELRDTAATLRRDLSEAIKRLASEQELNGRVGAAYDKGVKLYREAGGMEPGDLPPVRAELLAWALTRLEDAVKRMARRAGEIDDQRESKRVTIDAQSAAIETLTRQLAEANAALDAERSKVAARDAEVHRWIEQKGTTQEQLDKFMSACADQTIQIMELRGRVRALGGNPTEGPELYDVPEQAEPDTTDGIDRQRAADLLFAVMPAWADGAATRPLSYEVPLLRAWEQASAILAPVDAAPDPIAQALADGTHVADAENDDGFSLAAANEGARIAAESHDTED